MKRTTRLALALGASLLLTGVAHADDGATTDSTRTHLQQVVDGPQRAAANRARDAFRHPVETLAFFGIDASSHTLELWPGRGWYTEILAPFLRKSGKLTVTNYDPAGPQEETVYRLAKEFEAKIAADPESFGAVEIQRIAPPEQLELGPEGSYDLVLTFRNNHNWINNGFQEGVYAEVFRALKPGGVLGVVQHRAPEGADPETSAKNGYVPEAHLIAVAEAAGFELSGRSEINANPADTKDYPDGVWTLPPGYRLGSEDRERYTAIGESDRMTLRFTKPDDTTTE